MPQPLSVTLITLNAERVLDQALESVRFADEIIVVDSGSTDSTFEIVAKHGAVLIRQPWLGYGRQKQLAVEAATNDWVLCIDADEIVSPPLRAAITAALVTPRANAYAMRRCNRFMGRWLRHGEGYPDWSLRLFDRRSGRWSEDPVHEKVVTANPAQRLEGDLLHDSAESLSSYIAKQDRYSSLQAERVARENVAGNILKMIMSPLVRFVKFYFVRGGLLDGWPGLVHIAIGCRTTFAKYAKAIALGNRA